jgi:hypothetical protein
MGNCADVAVSGSYRLIYVVFNTLFNLLTQDEQVRCFENVAGHLMEDGSFVVEAFVPTYLTRLRDNQYVDAEAVEVNRVWLDVGRHDPVTQRLEETDTPLGLKLSGFSRPAGDGFQGGADTSHTGSAVRDGGLPAEPFWRQGDGLCIRSTGERPKNKPAVGTSGPCQRQDCTG